MKTYQFEIKETLCMIIEIKSDNKQEAEEKIRQIYNNKEYIPDSEYFVGVEFTTRREDMEKHFIKQKRYEYDR